MRHYRITDQKPGADLVVSLRRAGYKAWLELECGHEILVTDASISAIALTVGNAIVWLDELI